VQQAEPEPAERVENPYYDENTIIVELESGVAEVQAAAALETVAEDEATGIERVDGDVVLVDVAPELTVEQALQEAQALPEVKRAQYNYKYSALEALPDTGASALAAVNDPSRNLQWYLDKINAEEAWDIAKTDGEVLVAVIDSGANMNHPDLVNNIDKSKSYDVVNDTPNVVDVMTTGNVTYHGTHVAGIIAAQANNGVGIAGVSYNAKIAVYNVFTKVANGYSAFTSDMIKAYNMAVSNGAKVVNMSLGTYGEDHALEEAINKGVAAGVVTVCAGGNGDQFGNPKTDPIYPADYDACISVVPVDSSICACPAPIITSSRIYPLRAETYTAPRRTATATNRVLRWPRLLWRALRR
jgi:serine protease